MALCCFLTVGLCLAHSRRGDMEILGYNMLQWVCSKLPWEDDLSDPEKVAEQKRECMSNIPHFLRLCFPNDDPPCTWCNVD